MHFWVSNAKLSASWFVARFGFEEVAYRGLETGSRNVVSHVVKQGKIFFVFSSALTDHSTAELGGNIGEHVAKHGDGVKDVAFLVEDARAIFNSAVKRGGKVVAEPKELTDDHGSVVMASVQTYGDTIHSFVQRNEYRGAFLPGYRAVTKVDPLATITPPVGLDFIDHVVGNMPNEGMLPAVEWYERVLQVRRSASMHASLLSPIGLTILRQCLAHLPFFSHKLRFPLSHLTAPAVPSVLVGGRFANAHGVFSAALHRHGGVRGGNQDAHQRARPGQAQE